MLLGSSFLLPEWYNHCVLPQGLRKQMQQFPCMHVQLWTRRQQTVLTGQVKSKKHVKLALKHCSQIQSFHIWQFLKIPVMWVLLPLKEDKSTERQTHAQQKLFFLHWTSKTDTMLCKTSIEQLFVWVILIQKMSAMVFKEGYVRVRRWVIPVT